MDLTIWNKTGETLGTLGTLGTGDRETREIVETKETLGTSGTLPVPLKTAGIHTPFCNKASVVKFVCSIF